MDDLIPNTDDVVRALIMGTRDYVHKRGRTSVLLELSGDINSAVTAAIAAAALGGRNVRAVHLGPPAEEDADRIDVLDLAACLGIRLDRYDTEMIARIGDLISSAAKSSDTDVLPQPTDAAVGQMILKSGADVGGHMLLSSDDKTDVFLKGPSFLDAEFSMLSDIPKSLLWKTMHRLGEMGIPTFRNLSGGMPDAAFLLSSDPTLPLTSYEHIDLILDHCLVQRLCVETVISLGFDAPLTEKIFRMIKSTESKRRRAPLGINISAQGYGSVPRLPLGHQWISD